MAISVEEVFGGLLEKRIIYVQNGLNETILIDDFGVRKADGEYSFYAQSHNVFIRIPQNHNYARVFELLKSARVNTL